MKRELQGILVANGLYRREAEAMVATWTDSWFEQGSRLFYIAPRRMVDQVLPLTIMPRPDEVQRVFVGRIELVTAETRQAVKRALAANDGAALAAYGRFLPAIGARVIEENEPDRELFVRRLNTVSASWNVALRPCR